MSYQKDLDEFTAEELANEIKRRRKAREDGVCDYCGWELGCKPPCKFSDRHSGEAKIVDFVEVGHVS